MIFQRGAGGVAEAVAFALVAGLEAVDHGGLGRIGETPVFAESAMEPFGAAFGGLDGQRLQRVGLEVFAFGFVFLGALADAGPGADDEETD